MGGGGGLEGVERVGFFGSGGEGLVDVVFGRLSAGAEGSDLCGGDAVLDGGFLGWIAGTGASRSSSSLESVRCSSLGWSS